MITSMTAFARAEQSSSELCASLEIRSVNHRFCEISIRMPRACLPLEERIKGVIREKVTRGRVEVTLDLKSVAGEAAYCVNTELGMAYHQALADLRDALGLTDPVPFSLVARQEGVISKEVSQPDPEAIWPLVAGALDEALESFLRMRRVEGQALERDFTERLDLLARYLDDVEARAGEVPARVREKYAQRIAALAGDAADPARVAQEAAFFADKADITEEIVRARSHVVQFLFLVESPEAAGRSLNFLAQEMLREFSTMGAKSVDADMSHVVVAAKTEVEKLREQIANVE
ncbi:MAG: YicC family protein [Proteobacteria bacterium]|nr:YicC family protein [Pseudomonadota bacterium]